MSRTVKDSGLRADFPISKITPRRMTGVRSGGRAGALVEAVEHAIAVRVRRTALGVDARAGRRAGALVETVGHAIAVGVGGAALGVDVRPRGGTRALVEPVVHAVAV